MDQQTYKQALLDALYEPYKKCMMCPLATMGRTNVVFGQGNPNAALMFIGEGPGRDEDLQGEPFVGRSGKLLTKTIAGLGVSREDVYITNIVKCRPPNNRAPLPIESSTCMGLLLNKQIKIIRPKVICTLGAVAMQCILNTENKISKVRGTIQKKTVLLSYQPIILPIFYEMPAS